MTFLPGIEAPPADLMDRLCALRRPVTCSITPLTWMALPWMLRYTGGRVQELCLLQRRDIGTHAGRPCLHLGDSRTRRQLPIHPRLQVAVEALLQERTDLLFPDAGHPCVARQSYGQPFRAAWCREAEPIWPKALLSGWRAQLFRQLRPLLSVSESAWVFGIAAPKPWDDPGPPRWGAICAAFEQLP